MRSIIRKYLIRLPRVLFHQRPLFISAVQAMLVIGSFLLSWLLRFDFSLPYRRILLTSSLLLVVVRLITLRLFNLNHGWWHFALGPQRERIWARLREIDTQLIGISLFDTYTPNPLTEWSRFKACVDAILHAGGYEVIRVTWHMLIYEPELFVNAVRGALRRHAA